MRYTPGRELPAAPGKPSAIARHASHRFSDQADGTTKEFIGLVEGKPDRIITHDAQGRRTKIVRREMHGGVGGQMITTTEVATYNNEGLIERIDIQRSDGKNLSIPIDNQKTTDGGRTATWQYDANGHSWRAGQRYDAQGRLIETSSTLIAASARPRVTRLAYNEQGDVKTVELGTATESYEYQYDSVGNWIRRARFLTQDNKREAMDVEVRAFEYADAAPAKTTAAPPSTSPARSPKPADAAATALVGSYRHQRGRSGDPLAVTMNLQLQPDNKVRYSITTEAPSDLGGKTAKSATGSWTLANGQVTVTLDRSADGQPIPPQQRSLRLRVVEAGKSLTMVQDPGTTFVRVGE
jgi:hypothetical protein